MKTHFRIGISLLLSITLLAGAGSILHAVETSGEGQEVSLDDVGPFVSLMLEGSRSVKESSVTVEGNLDELDGAPAADLEAASKFVAEEYERVESAPESVTVTDRAHTAINDHLTLCLKMERNSKKSKLTFAALEFCQGVGTNLMHRLTVRNDEGEVLAKYTLDSFER